MKNRFSRAASAMNEGIATLAAYAVADDVGNDED